MESGFVIFPKEVMLRASRTILPPQLKSSPITRDSHGRWTPANTSIDIKGSPKYDWADLQRPSDTVRVTMMTPLEGTRSSSLESHGQLSGKSTPGLLPLLTAAITSSSFPSSSTSSSSSSLERCRREASSPGSSSSLAFRSDQDSKPSSGIKGSVLSLSTAASAGADRSWWTGAVAYEGSPTGRAVSKTYPACQPIRYGHVEALFSAVESRTVDRAMLPLVELENENDNTSCGALYHRIYDLILRHSNLHVVAAVHEYYETAGSEGRRSSGRQFWVVSRDARMPATSREDPTYMTSVALVLSEGLGSLYKALAAFPFRGINVTRLETRPCRQQPLLINPWTVHCTQSPIDPCTSINHAAHENHIQSHHCQFQYVVLIDFRGSTADLSTQNVLAQLQQHCSFLRILGSYPTFDFHHH